MAESIFSKMYDKMEGAFGPSDSTNLDSLEQSNTTNLPQKATTMNPSEAFRKKEGLSGEYVQERNLTPGQELTLGFEGYRTKPYLDTEGYLTIGAGHKMDTTKYDVEGPYGQQNLPEYAKDIELMPQTGGFELYRRDYASKAGEIGRKYGEGWSDVPSDIQDIMVDMGFNVGTEGLYDKFPGFVSDIKAGDYSSAAENLKYKDPSRMQGDSILSSYIDEQGKPQSNISDWYTQVGGIKTEEYVESDARHADVLKQNRATSHYNFLKDYQTEQVPMEDPTNYLMNQWTMPTSIEQ